MERTVFSWKVKDAEGKKQSYARIRVASDAAMEHLLFDSGEDDKASSLFYPVKLDLEPRTRYYWNVEAGSDAGETAVSEVQFFETGKRNEAWTGKWISCDSKENRHPYFEKEIVPAKEVAKARLYVCGLGPVSYTHLDVYKRQGMGHVRRTRKKKETVLRLMCGTKSCRCPSALSARSTESSAEAATAYG